MSAMPPTHSVVDEVVARHLARLHLGDATSVRPNLRERKPKEVKPQQERRRRPDRPEPKNSRRAKLAQEQRDREEFPKWMKELEGPIWPYEEDKSKRVHYPSENAPRRVYLLKDGQHIGYWNGYKYVATGPYVAAPVTLDDAKEEFRKYVEEAKLDLKNLDNLDQDYLDSLPNQEVHGKMDDNTDEYTAPDEFYDALDEFDLMGDDALSPDSRKAVDGLVDQALDAYAPTHQDDVDLLAYEKL